MKVAHSPARVRRAQIVSLSLTELMLLLVFMAIAFSFLAKKEGLDAVDRKDLEIQRLTRENKSMKADLVKTKAELAKLERFLSRIGIDGRTLRPTGGVITIDDQVFVLKDGHAPGAPLCKLTSKYLLSVALLDGSVVEIVEGPALKSDPALTKFGSLAAFNVGARMTLPDFRNAAENLQHAVASSGQDCRFAVRTVRRTKDADVFDEELRAVERYFYVARN